MAGVRLTEATAATMRHMEREGFMEDGFSDYDWFFRRLDELAKELRQEAVRRFGEVLSQDDSRWDEVNLPPAS